jgi:transcriptional regulator with XRE-family HTH domain
MNGSCAHHVRMLHAACVGRYSQYGQNVPKGYVVDVVSTWTGQLAGTLRVAWRLTIEDFAGKLGISVRTISKWEADQAFVPPLSMQQILDAALEQAPSPVKTRFGLLRTHDVVTPADKALEIRSGDGPEACTDEVALAAREAEAEQPGLLADSGHQSIAILWEETAEIARATNRSAWEAFTAARRVRQLALKMIEQTRRPAALSDLYVIAGQATALMASTAFDLNRWDASPILARSALSYAALVGDPSLQAWTLGLAALLANWRNEPDTALSHFGHGIQLAPPGTPAARLRYIAARSHALLGDSSSVKGVLDQARRDQDDAERYRDPLGDEIGGEFAFGHARAEACAAAAWLDLGRGKEAKESAELALTELAALPPCRQSLSQIAGARIDLATACLIQRERDQAEEILGKVFTVPAPVRNVSLLGRLERTRKVLGSPNWSEDGTARQLSDAISGLLAARS